VLRTLLAGALLLLVMRLRGTSMPRDADSWRRFLVQACLNSVVPYTLIAWAERSVESGLATILNSTSPIFVFFMAAAMGDPITPRRLFGAACGLVGVALIIGTEALSGLGTNLLGQLALVLGAVSYAGAVTFGQRFRDIDPMATAAGSMLVGGLLLLPFSLAFDHPWTLSPTRDAILALLALAVFSTAIAFVLFFRLIKTMGPALSAQAYLRVPIGVAIGVLFLGETLASTAWIGLGCVVIGVASMVTAPRKLA
jgi:drug/metabolite transporter (DMT)-like permease